MNKTSARIIAASSLGTILEWYDFSLFAYLTPVLAKLFFPHENVLTALMLTYAIFAVGFFVRPLGAILFGHLGDRIGRKKTLMWSVLLMSVPTCLIGLLPTYQTAGIIAPILLIILRIAQGLSVGGESTGAVLFVLESIPVKRRGLMGSFLWSMTAAGMLLGSLAGMIVNHFTQYPEGWRIPFILGIFTGWVAYFLRRRLPESALFEKAIANHEIKSFPLWTGISQYKSELIIIMGLYLLSAMITYLIFIFMPSYAATFLGMSLSQTSMVSTVCFACSIFLLPLGGYLSDKIGRATCLYWAALFFILLSYPLFKLIAHGSLSHFIIAQSIFLLLAAIFQGTITTAVLEILPTAVRYSVTAVGYNISYSLFGGTAPLMATFLVKITGDKSAPGLYLMLGACIAFFAANALRKKSIAQFTPQQMGLD